MSNVSESDIQNAIIEALVFDGWLVLRINQGGRHSIREQLKRYTPFAYWYMLGQPATDRGISDVLAVKARESFNPNCPDHDNLWILAVECKAPGRKSKVTQAQQQFLDAVREHGGIAIVADCLEDVEEYLDRVEVQ